MNSTFLTKFERIKICAKKSPSFHLEVLSHAMVGCEANVQNCAGYQMTHTILLSLSLSLSLSHTHTHTDNKNNGTLQTLR